MSDQKMTKAQAGALGGKATVEKHGRAHMQMIGRIGFQVTTDRYFGGDREAHAEYLREHGAFNYAQATGLPIKSDIWPTEAPAHPAHKQED
ncbi:MAG: hypothetical protein AAGD96_14430 [Chloroflexota bacterium]